MVNRQSPFSDGFLGMTPIRLRVGILGILGPSIGGKKKVFAYGSWKTHDNMWWIFAFLLLPWVLVSWIETYWNHTPRNNEAFPLHTNGANGAEWFTESGMWLQTPPFTGDGILLFNFNKPLKMVGFRSPQKINWFLVGGFNPSQKICVSSHFYPYLWLNNSHTVIHETPNQLTWWILDTWQKL